MLLKVGDKLTRSDFPDTDFSFHASRAYELVVGCKADCSDSTLMGVLNLPKQLAVIDSVGSDSTVSPSANNNFVREYSAVGVDVAASLLLSSMRLSSASSDDRVVIRIPESY